MSGGTVARSEGLGKMGSERIFVGRKAELERLVEAMTYSLKQEVAVTER